LKVKVQFFRDTSSNRKGFT